LLHSHDIGAIGFWQAGGRSGMTPPAGGQRFVGLVGKPYIGPGVVTAYRSLSFFQPLVAGSALLVYRG
jgi:hypothetical protein